MGKNMLAHSLTAMNPNCKDTYLAFLVFILDAGLFFEKSFQEQFHYCCPPPQVHQ